MHSIYTLFAFCVLLTEKYSPDKPFGLHLYTQMFDELAATLETSDGHSHAITGMFRLDSFLQYRLITVYCMVRIVSVWRLHYSTASQNLAIGRAIYS